MLLRGTVRTWQRKTGCEGCAQGCVGNSAGPAWLCVLIVRVSALLGEGKAQQGVSSENSPVVRLDFGHLSLIALYMRSSIHRMPSGVITQPFGVTAAVPRMTHLARAL